MSAPPWRTPRSSSPTPLPRPMRWRAPILRGAARVVRERALTPAQFGVDFLGAFDGPGQIPISAIAHEERIADFVTVTPRQPHAIAMQFMADATMLVTFAGW